MIINIEKRKYAENNYVYNLVSIEKCCEDFYEMLSKGFVSILNFREAEEYALRKYNLSENFYEDKYKKDEIGIYLNFSKMEDDGDYDYEENYIPSYTEEPVLYEITHCPHCGKKFIINIIEKKDIVKEYKELVNKRDSLKCKTKKEQLLSSKLYEEIQKLTRNNFLLKE